MRTLQLFIYTLFCFNIIILHEQKNPQNENFLLTMQQPTEENGLPQFLLTSSVVRHSSLLG